MNYAQMCELLSQYENDFNQNRQRIKDIKDLLEISKNPESYKEFQLKSGKKINTLILKTELAKLSMKNDSLKGAGGIASVSAFAFDGTSIVSLCKPVKYSSQGFTFFTTR